MTLTASDAVARVAELQAMFATLRGTTATAATSGGDGGFAAKLTQATATPAAAAAAAPAPATSFPATGAATPYATEIDAAAAHYGVDPALLRGLVKQESGFNPAARSGAGAVGLTQLMPATARELGVSDPTDPAQALDGGAKYLKQQLDRFGGDPSKALAAYNAGPGAVQKFGGVPPYAETQHYVQNVLAFAAQFRAQAPAAGAPVAALPTAPVLATTPGSIT